MEITTGVELQQLTYSKDPSPISSWNAFKVLQRQMILRNYGCYKMWNILHWAVMENFKLLKVLFKGQRIQFCNQNVDIVHWEDLKNKWERDTKSNNFLEFTCALPEWRHLAGRYLYIWCKNGASPCRMRDSEGVAEYCLFFRSKYVGSCQGTLALSSSLSDLRLATMDGIWWNSITKTRLWHYMLQTMVNKQDHSVSSCQRKSNTLWESSSFETNYTIYR